eukprot:767966-Hanusia_phi.AAC.1
MYMTFIPITLTCFQSPHLAYSSFPHAPVQVLLSILNLLAYIVLDFPLELWNQSKNGGQLGLETLQAPSTRARDILFSRIPISFDLDSKISRAHDQQAIDGGAASLRQRGKRYLENMPPPPELGDSKFGSPGKSFTWYRVAMRCWPGLYQTALVIISMLGLLSSPLYYVASMMDYLRMSGYCPCSPRHHPRSPAPSCSVPLSLYLPPTSCPFQPLPSFPSRTACRPVLTPETGGRVVLKSLYVGAPNLVSRAAGLSRAHLTFLADAVLYRGRALPDRLGGLSRCYPFPPPACVCVADSTFQQCVSKHIYDSFRGDITTVMPSPPSLSPIPPMLSSHTSRTLPSSPPSTTLASPCLAAHRPPGPWTVQHVDLPPARYLGRPVVSVADNLRASRPRLLEHAPAARHAGPDLRRVR